MNSRGKVEISVRFRCGKIDQRACCNVWVKPESLREESYVSVKGIESHRLIWCEPDSGMGHEDSAGDSSAKEMLERLISYIEECFCMARRHGVGSGWLADTIERFHAAERPRIEEERTEVLALIDAFMLASGMEESSHSRIEAYSLVRRSVARFEAFRRIRFPHFKLMAGRLDDAGLRAFECFMRKEHVWVKKYPQIARGPGLEGRTRPKSPNTVNDRMKLFKAVMSWAVRTRRIPHNPFDTYVNGQNVYGTPVYLSLDERRKVERLDLSANPRLALQRDIFIFQCCVGCRVSDLTGLTRSNVVDGEINYVARKTREGRPVTIKVPLNRTARTILARYTEPGRESLFPHIYSRVGYNNVIKEILRIAGIVRKVVVINPLTREAECRRLYEVASSHMARRTFIGNIYKKFKDQGLVSELSGHAPGSQSFTRYREIDSDIKREMVKAIE